MKSSVVLRSLLSLILLPSITVGCGGGSPTASVSQPTPVTQPPPPTPSSPPPLPSHWEATALPPITGAGAAQANALNNFGHVVGYSVENGAAHATLWEDGMAQDLGENTFANAINDSDQIVGYKLDDSFLAHAHLWPDDIDLGSIAGFDSSVATGINSSGLVVGVAFTQSNPNHQTAFSWSKSSGMQIVSGCASAEAINDAGEIAGISTSLNATICGKPDFNMPGAAVAINTAGATAGFSGPQSSTEAFVFPGTDLGPTLATGINDSEWVVGYKLTATGSVRTKSRTAIPRVTGNAQPWIWSKESGQVALPGITTPSAINKSGQIVGAVILGDQSTHGVLLTGK